MDLFAMTFGEVAALRMLEMDECRDGTRAPDRHAQDRRGAQVAHGLDAGELGIVGDAVEPHVVAGRDHAREQRAAEAARVAFELPRREAVEHAVFELAALGDLDEQPALGAGRATACSRIVRRTCVGSAT